MSTPLDKRAIYVGRFSPKEVRGTKYVPFFFTDTPTKGTIFSTDYPRLGGTTLMENQLLLKYKYLTIVEARLYGDYRPVGEHAGDSRYEHVPSHAIPE